jgi:hypothetical protein
MDGKCLGGILKGYSKKDYYSGDETGCIFNMNLWMGRG